MSVLIHNFRFSYLGLGTVAAFCVALGSALLGSSLVAASTVPDEYAIKAPLAEQSLLLDVARAGESLVAVGERGHILVKKNGEHSWRQVDVPTRTTLTAVYFHDARLGVAVGHDATILRSEDGGLHWQRVFQAPEEETPLLDIRFQDAQRGIAIGAYGLMLVTSDGGRTWARQPLIVKPVIFTIDAERSLADSAEQDAANLSLTDSSAEENIDFHLNQISQATNGKLYIAAEAGNIYRSDDEGKTWMLLPSPYEGSFFGVLPLQGDSLLIFGLRGHLFRSDDAGMSWQALDSSTQAMLTAGLQTDEKVIVLAGLGGAVLTSYDGGHNYLLKSQADRMGVAAIIEATDGSLVMVGEGGKKRLPHSEFTVANKP